MNTIAKKTGNVNKIFVTFAEHFVEYWSVFHAFFTGQNRPFRPFSHKTLAPQRPEIIWHFFFHFKIFVNVRSILLQNY